MIRQKAADGISQISPPASDSRGIEISSFQINRKIGMESSMDPESEEIPREFHDLQ